jgi:hypothetical protein
VTASVPVRKSQPTDPTYARVAESDDILIDPDYITSGGAPARIRLLSSPGSGSRSRRSSSGSPSIVSATR